MSTRREVKWRPGDRAWHTDRGPVVLVSRAHGSKVRARTARGSEVLCPSKLRLAHSPATKVTNNIKNL